MSINENQATDQIDVKVARMEVQIESIEYAQRNMAEKLENLNQITISIKDLANSVNSLAKSQENFNKRLSSIEQIPASKWNVISKTALTAIVSAIAGGFALAMIQLLSTNMH